ncbi:hypothetical protein AVEN_258833-1 [Araneus ventricosus]|uniref:Uncharacterized protein n=1 Tax=Araneus ventricosus TaxID=182803 RepID=A0A4Y2KQD1_ARAVE|nr:hypothetical protein AVEN_258833-1 [Araneus ventricosus]
MCRPRSRRFRGSKHDFNEKSVVYWASCKLNHIYRFKGPPSGVVRKFGEEVPVQMPFSSSDRGSKLRGPSQNSPRVAAKWDVNITKLNLTIAVYLKEI